MKIVLIIHSLGLGGMERVMALLATYFSKKPLVEVHLILIGIKREVAYPLPVEVRIHFPDFEFDNNKRTWYTLKTMFFLRRKVQSLQPSSVLSFGEYWNNLVLMSLLGLPYPVYVSDRSQPNKNLGKIQNILRNRLYPKASGFIAQTGIAKEVAKNLNWNKRIEVIGNPIRTIELSNDIPKENIVLTVGRLIPTKNIDQLLQIFEEVALKDWKLVVIGGNAKKMNLLEKYQSQIKEKGLEERIIFKGAQSDVDTYYAKSRIFAFASSSEGFPNVLGEAMNAGLAVLAYDCVAGPSDMIDDGYNGYLIPLGNKSLFSEKLKILMQNQHQREKFGHNAKLKMQEFESEKIADQFFKFISSRV
ncbi:glycosyltransferase [Pararhodonellum marinum]|uniref:glycosyltransferase n=1 Tax=Pararhodonellum marinum TaxID=2755358 RepID=UPI00188E3C6A|nr:glycosyltransferase [Pararhodonellum marinum]